MQLTARQFLLLSSRVIKKQVRSRTDWLPCCFVVVVLAVAVGVPPLYYSARS